jgi:hypothetical protein
MSKGGKEVAKDLAAKLVNNGKGVRPQRTRQPS